MKRREFIALIGGAAAWPLAARAQQPSMPVVGFLSSLIASQSQHLLAGFRRGLVQTDFTEGQNVAIEYRWADGVYDRLPALAAELVKRRVAVIASMGGQPAVLAAKAVTTAIPIVFASGSDPVKAGIVDSLGRPGGNLTGVHVLTAGFEAKRFGLVHELAPRSAAIAVLINPNNPNSADQLRDVEEAARPLQIVHASGAGDLDVAFAKIAASKPGALLVASDPALSVLREPLVTRSERYAIPTIYQWREFAAAGGLMSYGTDLPDAYRLAGIYAGRILKGAKASDLPVQQSVKFELVINLKTAKSLGVIIPPGILAIADEVIE